MQKFILFCLLFSVSTVFASDLTIDFQKLQPAKLEKKFTVPYGKNENAVGIHIAENQDEQNYGVSSFLVNNGIFYLVDSVNNLLKSAAVKNFGFSSFLKIEPMTIDILHDSRNLYLYNSDSSEISKIAKGKTVSTTKMKITSPTYKDFKTDLLSEIQKKDETLITVKKENPQKASVLITGRGKYSLSVKNTKLGSLQFISKDSSGNLHFIIETLESMNPIKVKRYWIATDNKLNLLSIFSLPISDMFLPFREIQVNSDGSIWFINHSHNGLEILYGKGRK